MIKLVSNPQVKDKFRSYPPEARQKLEQLRQLILDVADELDEVQQIDETLKWGEPSYIAKKGTTIRIDWKDRSPDQYAMYFNCQSSLVPTFKIVFGDALNYEKSRAVVFDMNTDLPEPEVRECISRALLYHRVKDKPLLGL